MPISAGLQVPVQRRALHAPGVVVIKEHAGVGIDEYEARGEIRALGCHSDGRGPPRIPTAYVGLLDASGRQHRDRLLGLAFYRRRDPGRERIGSPTPLDIEDHWAGEAGDPLVPMAARERVLSQQQAWRRTSDVEEVRPLPSAHAVRDRRLANLRIPDVARRHAVILPTSWTGRWRARDGELWK